MLDAPFDFGGYYLEFRPPIRVPNSGQTEVQANKLLLPDGQSLTLNSSVEASFYASLYGTGKSPALRLEQFFLAKAARRRHCAVLFVSLLMLVLAAFWTNQAWVFLLWLPLAPHFARSEGRRLRALAPFPLQDLFSHQLALVAFPLGIFFEKGLYSDAVASGVDPLSQISAEQLPRPELVRLLRSRFAEQARLRQWLKLQDLDELLRPIEPKPDTLAYCPACGAEYAQQLAQCRDCAAVALVRIQQAGIQRAG